MEKNEKRIRIVQVKKVSHKVLKRSLAIFIMYIIWVQISVGVIPASGVDESIAIDTRFDELEDRLANLERLLTEVIASLDNIHSTYATEQVLTLKLEVVETQIAAVESTIEVKLDAQDDKLDRTIQTQYVILAAILGPHILRAPETLKRLKNNKEKNP